MVTNEHGRPVSRFKDGEATPAEAARIEAHLAECAECRKAADVIDAVRRHIGEWTAPEPPGDLARRVLTRVHDRAANILSMKSHLKLTAAAAAVLLVASLALFPFVGGRAAPAAPPRDEIADVALEQLMQDIGVGNLAARTDEEADR